MAQADDDRRICVGQAVGGATADRAVVVGPENRVAQPADLAGVEEEPVPGLAFLEPVVLGVPRRLPSARLGASARVPARLR